jgi:phosphatidylglycerol:prolipoprotein diacylglycerol transferase
MRIGTTRERLPRERLASAFLVTGVFAILGARLLFVLTNLDTLPGPASWLSFREGGVVAYGGFLGGLFGAWLAWRRRGAELLTWGDIAAPAVGLGLGLTRIGCYLYGCDFGRPLGSDAPGWLKTIGTFPGPRPGLLPSPAFLDQLARHQLSPSATTSLPVHPTQLYESLLGFALFFFALAIWRHRRFRGQALLALTVLYGVGRFLLEIVRDDSQRGIYFGLSTSQWISLALVPLGLVLYLRLRRAEPVPVHARASDVPRARAPLSSR